MHKTIIFTNVLSLLQHSSENDCERVLPGCPIHGLKKPPWFGDDPCRGRFIGLPGVMCELCPCPCCKWGGEFHTLSTLTGLSVNEQPVADKHHMTSLLFCLPHYRIQVFSSVVNFSGILFADSERGSF